MANKGFTLLELLVVIAIMGLLASMVLVTFPSAMESTRDGIRKRDLDTIRMGLEDYWGVYGHYPTEALCLDFSVGSNGCLIPVPPADYWHANSDLQDLVAHGSFGEIPTDPINNATYYYSYEPDGMGQAGCLVNTCQWQLCARLETTGANYCLYSVRNSDTHPRGE